MWKWTKINIKLEDGLEVIIGGKITAYTGRSSYQITAETIDISGIGSLLKIIEERKQRLSKEGLFDPIHKKTIPLLPKTIGVITSQTGAVIQDIIHRISERFPTRILLYPVAVQGEVEDIQISSAIDNFNKIKGENRPDVIIVARGGGSVQDLMPFNEEKGENRPDVIIVARGGGSVQDLMPFNEENVVRSVFNSTIPIISAVGHETDTTLIDYVSDLRAPTPTGAAEKAVPVRSELLVNINEKGNFLTNTILRLFDNFKLKIQSLSNAIKSPTQFITDAMQRLDDKTNRLNFLMNTKANTLNEKLNYIDKMLESYSFKNVLKRGYSIIWDKDKIISTKDELEKLSTATIQFYDGKTNIFTQQNNTNTNKKTSHKKTEKPEPTSNLQGDLF